MSSWSPKISVIMSAYNGSPDYLRESIDSVLKQSFTDFEFIIIDDGSSDDSWSTLSDYAVSDRRIRLLRNRQNMGLTKSLNKGLSHAQGEYVARQDADDISLPTRFEKQVAWLKEHPETVLVSSEIQRIKPDGTFGKVTERACPSELLPWHLIFHNHLGGHSQVMFRRQSVLELGGYNEAYRYSQDYELWCRLVKVGDLGVLPEALLNQRFHNASISAGKRLEQSELVLKQVALNIEQLTGQALPLSEIENLHRLWSTEQTSKAERFPEPELASCLNQRLASIYQGYVEHLQSSSSPVSRQALQAVIGQKFLDWAGSVSVRKQLSAKIKLYLIALCWSPGQLLKYPMFKKKPISPRWEIANG